MSATEAEYIAASEAAMEAVWIRKFIPGLGIVPTINESIKMLCDNSAALHFTNEPRVQKGARHYHRRYHYVRESIKLGEIKFLKVYTNENLSNPFKKALSKGKLTQHARSMGLRLASSFIESSPNPTSSNPKRRNRRRSKQPFILEESPVDTMADQRTMAEFLCAPTEGYAILAEQFELKHSLINMMTSDRFFGLEKDNPHDHIHLVSKFIDEFFPPSRTTNLRNEISNFQQRFDESFHEAWDRYKDLLRACPQHGFTELHQLDTFYIALNSTDQDSLNSAASGNLLERRTQDVLMIIKNKSKKILKALLSNKEKLLELANTPLNENCSTVILKKLLEKLGDHGKFLIHVVLVTSKSDLRVPLILGRPFLRTARALIDVHGEEMILHDGDEILTLNIRHDTSSYSNQPQKESINMINIFNDSCEDYHEDLVATNHLNGNPTFSSHTNLTSLEVKDDIFDPEEDMLLALKSQTRMSTVYEY
nr:retrovirus-related Pol polyprotein from transposon TNT 1-94 [Tanacetum cinerariifolium]